MRSILLPFARTTISRSNKDTVTPRTIEPRLTLAGWLAAGAYALVMMYSVRYQLNLGYLIATFGLAMVLGSVVACATRLRGLAVHCDPVAPGGPVGSVRHFVLHLRAPKRRFANALLSVEFPGGSVAVHLRDGTASVMIPAMLRDRGLVGCPRLLFTGTCPMGFWHVAHASQPNQIIPAWPAGTGEAQTTSPEPGWEHFDLRPYQPGDRISRVDWRATARRGLPMVRADARAQTRARLASQWIDWSSLPTDVDYEEGLKRLSGQVREAERAGAAYGLRLPQAVLPPAVGPAHLTACLSTLAFAPGYKASLGRP